MGQIFGQSARPSCLHTKSTTDNILFIVPRISGGTHSRLFMTNVLHPEGKNRNVLEGVASAQVHPLPSKPLVDTVSVPGNICRLKTACEYDPRDNQRLVTVVYTEEKRE